MLDSETARIFQMFLAAYPSSHVGTGTPQVWLELLADVDSSLAEEAAVRLCRRLSWFPSVADFRKEVEAVRREREPSGGNLRDAGPPADEATAREFIEMARKVLVAHKRGVAHWHGGPNPCPRCATIPPPFNAPPKVVTTDEESF